MTRRARWWLLPVVVAAVLAVSACSSGRAERCEAAFKAVATSVEGVASAEWDCSFQFGGGWQRGDVVIEARPAGAQSVAVTHHGGSVDDAYSGAAQKLEKVLDTKYSRAHDHKGGDTIRHMASIDDSN